MNGGTVRKVLARGAVAMLDNSDALLGVFDRALWILFSVLLSRGSWFSAVLVFVLALVCWYLKKIEPGPVVSFLKKEPGKVRDKLVSLTKTVYKG